MPLGAVIKSKKRVAAREALAAHITAFREDKGGSQEALAFETGLRRTFVAHVERLARNIAVYNIERLALGVEPYELLHPRWQLIASKPKISSTNRR
jgi:hypothetical protein